MRDLSGLLLLLTGVTTLFGIASLYDASNEDDVAGAIGILIAVVLYFFVAIKIRRGSTVALGAAGILFLIDTLTILLASPAALLGRGLLLFFVLRSLQRHRKDANA